MALGWGEMPISISSSPQEAATAICQWEQRQRGQQMAENVIIYQPVLASGSAWCEPSPPGCQKWGITLGAGCEEMNP